MKGFIPHHDAFYQFEYKHLYNIAGLSTSLLDVSFSMLIFPF